MIKLLLQMMESESLKNLFLKLVNMSISASWIVLVVLILRLVLKKAPKWIPVLLWGIVAVRLICPFSIESALSLIPSTQTIPMNIEMAAKPAIDSGINAVNSVVNPIISASFTPHPGVSANPLQIWIPLAAVIWCFGMALMVLYTAISYWNLCRKVDTAVRYNGNIYQSENVGSPFVLGILKPRIYLPYSMDGKNLEHVVAHEQAHIRRKDHWWKPLGFLLLTVYWFNPLMWMAYILLCRDIELACDEKVIAELGNEQRADYTQALVACSVNRRMIAACPLAFGEVGVKDRVKAIMNYRKPAFWLVVASTIVCLIVAVCFLTNPQKHEVVPNIYGAIDSSKWKISLKADNITPGGATITLIQDGGFLPNRLFYGDDYSLEKYENNHWVAIEPENDLVWNTIAYTVPLNGSITWNINWSNTFGKLEPGIYRFCKSIADHGVPGETVHEVYTVELIIPDNESDGKEILLAKVIEVHDGYFVVEPVEGSWELNSASRIEVPMKNMEPSPEPQVGDILEIEYDGHLQETYPARISNPYNIKVIEEAVSWDLIPMVMVDGVLYLDTGMESTAMARCGMLDGEITSQVDGSQQPTIDDQSNFGTGYGYQYGAMEGTVEIYMNEKWWIFATEEARKEIQFPTESIESKIPDKQTVEEYVIDYTVNQVMSGQKKADITILSITDQYAFVHTVGESQELLVYHYTYDKIYGNLNITGIVRGDPDSNAEMSINHFRLDDQHVYFGTIKLNHGQSVDNPLLPTEKLSVKFIGESGEAFETSLQDNSFYLTTLESPLESFELLDSEEQVLWDLERYLNHGYVIQESSLLIAALGSNGTRGFVKAEDLDGDLPSNPAEAVAYMEEMERKTAYGTKKYVRLIPLYAEDGVTVIGEFAIG